MTAPHVDLVTKEIKGCEPKSWMWHHEMGHLKFNEKYPSFEFWREQLLYVWITLITISVIYRIVWILAALTLIAHFFMGLYEEFWCNNYANKIKGGET